MPYCPKCGVEVDHDTAQCPLCSFDIPEIPHKEENPDIEFELKNYYDELRELKKIRKKRAKAVAFIIILLGTIFTGFNNTMQDWYAHGTLTFSPYVLSSLGMFIGILICLFGFIKSWKKIFIFQYFLSSLFLFSIDYYSNGTSWFLSVGLPITTSSFGLTYLAIYLIQKGKRGGLYNSGVIMTGVAVMVILVELILDLNKNELKLTWSIQVFITALSLAAVFLLARKLVHAESFKKLKRFFHF